MINKHFSLYFDVIEAFTPFADTFFVLAFKFMQKYYLIELSPEMTIQIILMIEVFLSFDKSFDKNFDLVLDSYHRNIFTVMTIFLTC